MPKGNLLDFNTAICRSLRNIIVFGDTDVFPHPFENQLFNDRFDQCVTILENWHGDFDLAKRNTPPLKVDALYQVGYTGFRRVTALEPFCNAYYLALVLRLARRIEEIRVPTQERVVFSYRFNENGVDSIFQDSTWIHYRNRSRELAEEHAYVVLTDVSDFYARVNHHRLDNFLKPLAECDNTPTQILSLLKTFSDRYSHGLPVGGAASRLLSELALVDVDRALLSTRTVFCRYSDDYTLFCSSKAEATKLLVGLAEALALEGLTLQKHKTRVMSRKEFLQMCEHLDPSLKGKEEQQLLGLTLKFDPYSPTADEDYIALKKTVANIDIVGLLTREVAKTEVDQRLTRQALKALVVLEPKEQENALSVLLSSENTNVLSPVFPHLMRVVRNIYTDLGSSAKDAVDKNLVSLFTHGSPLLSVEVNRLYFVQALSKRHSDEKVKVIVALYEHNNSSHLLRRMITHTMANWECGFFLKRLLPEFPTLSTWEKRALLVSSFQLNDQGAHWRHQHKKGFDQVESLICEWAGAQKHHQRKILV